MAKDRQRSGRGEAYWRRVVRQQGASGLTVREFCHQSKLRESAFYSWRKELLRRDAASKQSWDPVRPPAQAAFIPVSVTAGAAESVQEDAASQTGRIEIVLSGGRRVCLTAPVDRQALVDVLAALEAQPC